MVPFCWYVHTYMCTIMVLIHTALPALIPISQKRLEMPWNTTYSSTMVLVFQVVFEIMYHWYQGNSTMVAAKYADRDNFIPFILETGGRVDKAARDWLDALTAPEPGEQVPSQDDHPWNPQARTTTETVTCLRRLWWRSALQTSLSSWNRSIPWCLLCWQRPRVSPWHLCACISRRFSFLR